MLVPIHRHLNVRVLLYQLYQKCRPPKILEVLISTQPSVSYSVSGNSTDGSPDGRK